MNPGSDMPCDCASVETDWLPLPSASSTSRRVGSDSAAKTWSSTSSSRLTMRFSIVSAMRDVKNYSFRGRAVDDGLLSAAAARRADFPCSSNAFNRARSRLTQSPSAANLASSIEGWR